MTTFLTEVPQKAKTTSNDDAHLTIEVLFIPFFVCVHPALIELAKIVLVERFIPRNHAVEASQINLKRFSPHI